ncbi:WXG100 family type VII secretion target [Saccharothrix obliqua]|uniref:WXG100 family type VII secretion target n=1 Tax=Saccharothrix obliqua TaxID=2861747 RepID=UPI001C5DE799|nr:hypothetical protein [Saccharothrix obliqua]MBW4716079.1 hypothetical protein [Saccharothrix obliqua]
MGIEIPGEVAWLVPIVVGRSWPEGDETALRRMADAYRTAARGVRSVIDQADTAASAVVGSQEGVAARRFEEHWGEYTAGDDARLPALQRACEELAETCERAALEVEHAKLAIIAALLALAVEISALVAAAFGTFGVSTAGIPVAQQAARATVQDTFRRLVTAMLRDVAVPDGVDIAARTGRVEGSPVGGSPVEGSTVTGGVLTKGKHPGQLPGTTSGQAVNAPDVVTTSAAAVSSAPVSSTPAAPVPGATRDVPPQPVITAPPGGSTGQSPTRPGNDTTTTSHAPPAPRETAGRSTGVAAAPEAHRNGPVGGGGTGAVPTPTRPGTTPRTSGGSSISGRLGGPPGTGSPGGRSTSPGGPESRAGSRSGSVPGVTAGPTSGVLPGAGQGNGGAPPPGRSPGAGGPTTSGPAAGGAVSTGGAGLLPATAVAAGGRGPSAGGRAARAKPERDDESRDTDTDPAEEPADDPAGDPADDTLTGVPAEPFRETTPAPPNPVATRTWPAEPLSHKEIPGSTPPRLVELPAGTVLERSGSPEGDVMSPLRSDNAKNPHVYVLTTPIRVTADRPGGTPGFRPVPTPALVDPATGGVSVRRLLDLGVLREATAPPTTDRPDCTPEATWRRMERDRSNFVRAGGTVEIIDTFTRCDPPRHPHAYRTRWRVTLADGTTEIYVRSYPDEPTAAR